MRRKPKEKPIKRPYEVTSHSSWFCWEKCCECGNEVRREIVYEISIRWYRKLIAGPLGIVCRSDGISTDIYNFCSECCGSMTDAENLFIVKYLPLYTEA